MYGASHVSAPRLTSESTSSCLRRWLNFSTVLQGRFCSIIQPNSTFGATEGSYLPRTWFSCSHMVVKTLMYCTRKCGCKGGCMSASCFLQPPRNGSGPRSSTWNFLYDSPKFSLGLSWEHLIHARGVPTTVLEKIYLPGRGPDQLNRCEVAAENSLLTCSHLCSHISWYKTIGVLLPCGCSWITFWENSHWEKPLLRFFGVWVVMLPHS